ncbi:Hypothetical protein D9617_21g096320 [Elsinoe fawcettii]|nr:Hypothetical protein D9617_21g096320 [Elsinoe fawcettii]
MTKARIRPVTQVCAFAASPRHTVTSRERSWTSACTSLYAAHYLGAQAPLYRTCRPSLSSRSRPQQTRTFLTTKKQSTEPLPAVPEDVAEQQILIRSLYQQISQEPRVTKKVPEEKEILEVLQKFQAVADRYPSNHERSVPGQAAKGSASTATSAMLKAMNRDQPGANITPMDILNNISEKATELLELPHIFISADILKAYIKLQSHLNRPQTFPAIFDLYRNKPSPRPLDKEPYITFAAPSPNAPAVAVHPDVAETALTAAIKYHSLPLALSVIDNTYCHPSYARFKIIKSAVVPIAGTVLAPLAAYSLANQFALVQTTMDTAHATTVAMAGIMTYVAVVGSMGYIAVTTANDQMVRVTWASGMPLWERWVREEERAAVDQIAQAWGFRNRTRWGDEEGAE